MGLLDFYRSRFGDAVRQQGNGYNGPCPLCGGTPGKSDRFMIWPDRDESLGKTCQENGISGVWSCRKCGESGDTIAYLMKIDGHDFKSALAALGIKGGRPSFRRKKAPALPPETSAPIIREAAGASSVWQEAADKVIQKAEAALPDFPYALAWLAARGISLQAARAYRLGYLAAEAGTYPGTFRPRQAFGLEPKEGEGGRVKDKIFIPRGILVPTFDASGRPSNIRIRRPSKDIGQGRPKYMELEGSSRAPYFLRSSAPAPLAVYFVTEAELDALLIHHLSGGIVGALAVRTNRGKPDAVAHAYLKQASRICIALDYDEAGASGVEFWEKTYPSILRWPTPEGKDPGDAFKLGVDIRAWIEAALPASVRLPEVQRAQEPSPLSGGQVDTALPGQIVRGEGASRQASDGGPKKKNVPAGASSMSAGCGWGPDAREEDFTDEELDLLYAAIPPTQPLERYPVGIARAWLAWRGLPVRFVKRGFIDGRLECGWERCAGWRKHLKKLLAFSPVARQPWLLAWLRNHPADVVTEENFFQMWGE